MEGKTTALEEWGDLTKNNTWGKSLSVSERRNIHMGNSIDVNFEEAVAFYQTLF